MLRVVLTVLMHGAVFGAVWWQQWRAAPQGMTGGAAYWLQSMSGGRWAVLAFMLVVPALSLLSCPRQSVRGRMLLLANGVFALWLLWAAGQSAAYPLWRDWLLFSVAMFGIAWFNRLSARIGRASAAVGRSWG